MLKMIHLLLFLMSSSLTTAYAAPKCNSLFLDLGKHVEHKLQTKENTPSELNLKAKSYEAIGDPKLVSEEVSDLILMMSQSRTPIISNKEINEKGKLNLGMPIGNGFFLEMKYKSNSSQEDKFVLDHINVLSPSGKQIDVSSNPIDVYNERELSSHRTNFELGVYPDGHIITATIPTLIKGDVLKEIKALAPKLELLPKDVIREITREADLKELKSKGNKAYMKYFIKRYSVRGVFKTLFKVIVYEPLKMLFSVGIIYSAIHLTGTVDGPNKITEFLIPKQNTEWVAKSIEASAQSKSIPESVRSQLRNLENDLKNNPNYKPQSEMRSDQNGPKLQISKDQYLWTTQITDKESGKTASVIFVSRDNGHGQINYSAIVVDPAKYGQLINYIRSLGQFISVSAEDLK